MSKHKHPEYFSHKRQTCTRALLVIFRMFGCNQIYLMKSKEPSILNNNLPGVKEGCLLSKASAGCQKKIVWEDGTVGLH